MSNTRHLRVSPDLELPLDVITEALAILAARGAGKSNTAVVIAEEMYDAGLPWVAIDPKGDWHGIRASGDGTAPGLSVVVFGGLHGDVPLEPTAGRLVADLVVDQRVTCVLDVSEMTKADQRRFLLDFAERLYRRNTEPLHVFCEEADEYIPQMVRGEAAKLVGAFETLVKRGRFRGIGVTLITQRSASLNKDVLTQVETLIAMRTPSPQDRKAILAWVDVHDAGRGLVDQLPTLDSGEAWVFSPHALKVVKKIRFRRRRTFDSGATPKVGGKPKPPATLADVDLAAIKEAMAETIERAKADDPKELRKQIAELKRHRCPEPATVEPERIEVPVLDDATRELVETVIAQWDDAYGQAVEVVNTLRDALARTQTRQGAAPRRVAQPASRRVGASRQAAKPNAEPTPSGRVQPRPAATGADVQFGKCERAVLTVLAQHPDGRTRQQLTSLTGYTYSGGFRNSLSALRTAGYMVGGNGETMHATDEGLVALGDWEPLPTGDALYRHWLGRLGKAEAAALTRLIEVYPQHIDGPTLAAECGYEYSGGFRNALSRLRTLELIRGGNTSGMTVDDDFITAIRSA